jgi:protein CpxP
MGHTLRKILLAGALAGSMSAAVLAQDPAPPQDGPRGPEARGQRGPGRLGPGGGRMGRRLHGRAAGRLALRGLDLSDAQREQIRGMAERLREGNKARHDELRQLMQLRRGGGQLTAEQQARAQELVKSLRESRQSLHQEMLGVLTPEQRTQLEQRRKEMQERREQFRERRQRLRGETM